MGLIRVLSCKEAEAILQWNSHGVVLLAAYAGCGEKGVKNYWATTARASVTHHFERYNRVLVLLHIRTP